MPTRHAILGPSGAYRWLTCTPSARFEEQIPEEETVYAREGTLAHDLAALVLEATLYGADAGTEDQLRVLKAEVDAFYEALDQPSGWNEMSDHAEGWVSWVLAHEADIHFIEREYDLNQFVPLGFGTSDYTGRAPSVLYVDDYKYGAGQVVSPVDNPQLMLYGLGALLAAVIEDPTYKPDYVVLSIYQPRAGGFGGSSWQIGVSDLLKWAEFEVAPKANLAIAGQGEFIAGKHCGFCKARNVCKAYFDHFAEMLAITDQRVMTPADLALVLKYGGMVSGWVKKVIEDAAAQLKTGKKIEGFKLVAGGGKRAFTSEDDVVDILIGEGYESDQIFKAELRALTDLEKIVGKKNFDKLLGPVIMTKEYAPQIAPEDDPRPSVNASAHDDYNDEDLT